MKLLEETLKETFQNVMERIPSILEYKDICENCGSEIGRKAAYCPYCGFGLVFDTETEE
jgi:rRNA maturation endonuclease Nob1